MGQEVTEKNGLCEELQRTASAMRLNLKHTYSKEFLLSLAELEDCKKLPAGLDSSLLRETQSKVDERGVAIPGASTRGLIRTMRETDAHSESPPDVPEWRRPSSLPGSPFLKSGPRQVETKVSSPRPGPARAGNNAARSIMGRSGSARWELRSNGEERDRDMIRTQFEWELSSLAESSGAFQTRSIVRSGLMVSQEHDGLLGSGGPIVHRGMIQTPAHDRHCAERTSRIGRFGEQYHSTRGGKVLRNSAVSQYPRRNDTDSVSDETFNSDDWLNGERSEQERQRRDQFEQMRKELRKKPLNTARNNHDLWLGESMQITEAFLSSSPGTPQSSSSKDDSSKPHNRPMATSSTPRLLVPPGFSKPILSKIDSPKENYEESKNYTPDVKPDVKVDDNHALRQTGSNDGVKLDNEEQFHSLLMKLNERDDDNEKTFSPSQSPVMSKFARWFPSQGPNLQESGSNSEPLYVNTKHEDLQLPHDSSSTTAEPSGISENNVMSELSSIASLMPIKSKVSVLPMPVGPSLEDVEKVMTAGANFGQVEESCEKLNKTNQEEHELLVESDHADTCAQTLDSLRPLSKDVQGKKIPPVFLTCEDLEQSLLSESVYTQNHPTQQNMDKNLDLMELLEIRSSKKEGRNKADGWVIKQHSEDMMDGTASTHLMSLLQKNAGGTLPLEDATGVIPVQPSAYSTGLNSPETEQCNTTEVISLETLFGRKFVNELRSVGEPVSSKHVVDGSIHNAKEDTSAGPSNKSQTRRLGHADVSFHEATGWTYKSHILTEPTGSEISSGSGLQDTFLIDGSTHHNPSMKTSKKLSSARGVAANGSAFVDLMQQKLSHHPQQHHEGYHRQTSEMPSHRLLLEPIQDAHVIHENSLHSIGLFTPNSLLYPLQEQILQAGRHIPVQFKEHSSLVGGMYGMPSTASPDYRESLQISFNPSQGAPDPGLVDSQINPLADKWFPSDNIRASQGFAGFNPYQHEIIDERKSGFGVSGIGLGPGVQSYNAGLPSERRGKSETYDQYTFLASRPSYG